MIMQPIVVPSTDGEVTFDAVAIYQTVKSAFLADYADDPAVSEKIYRNGDIAESEYSGTLKGISPEACARVSPKEIQDTMESIARLALCHVAVGYGSRRRKAA